MHVGHRLPKNKHCHFGHLPGMRMITRALRVNFSPLQADVRQDLQQQAAPGDFRHDLGLFQSTSSGGSLLRNPKTA